MSQVIFEPVEHRYFQDKKEYPSVSKIMDHFGLLPDYDRFGNDTSRDFGKAVHRICELHDKNDIGNYDSALEPYLNGYKKFLAHFKPKWQLIEEPLISKVWGFAGTSDRFGMIKRNAVVDFKSGTSEPYHAIQTALYQVLIEDNLKIKVQERYTLTLMSNDFRFIPHTNKSDRSVAIGLVQAYKWKLNNRLIKE